VFKLIWSEIGCMVFELVNLVASGTSVQSTLACLICLNAQDSRKKTFAHTNPLIGKNHRLSPQSNGLPNKNTATDSRAVLSAPQDSRNGVISIAIAEYVATKNKQYLTNFIYAM
jgi:hypothetical protein